MLAITPGFISTELGGVWTWALGASTISLYEEGDIQLLALVSSDVDLSTRPDTSLTKCIVDLQ